MGKRMSAMLAALTTEIESHTESFTNVLIRKIQYGSDLHLIYEVVIVIHPLGADPCTILSQMPGNTNWVSVLHLKVIFFHPPTSRVSISVSFEWNSILAYSPR